MSEPVSAAKTNLLSSESWLWLLALTALALAHLLTFPTLWDDAFISFRVAENWAQQGSMAYNPGRPEPVATNFLWLALLAAGHRLAGLNIPRLAQVLGGLAGLLIPATLFLGLHGLQEKKAAVPATLICLSGAAWAAWPLSGLETSLFAWLSLAGLVSLLLFWKPRGSGWLAVSGAAFGLAALTRPEGFLVFGLCWLVMLLRNWRRPRRWLLYLMAFAVPVIPGVIWQWLNFHTLLPNAFFAKLHGLANLRAGWAYLKDFFATYHLLYFVPFLLPAFFRTGGARPGGVQWESVFILGLGAAWMAWVAVVGGDFMPYHRFLSPLWPWFCLLAGLGLSRLESILEKALAAPNRNSETRAGASLKMAWLPGAVMASSTAFFAFLVLLPTYAGPHHAQVRSWAREEADRALVGKWLGRRYPAADLLACKPAGIIPYYSGLQAVDFYSLVDRRAALTGEWIQGHWVGHQRIHVSRILDLAPRVVILDEHLYAQDRLPEPAAGAGAVETAWRADARSRDYVAVRVEVASGRWLQYFERSRYLK